MKQRCFVKLLSTEATTLKKKPARAKKRQEQKINRQIKSKKSLEPKACEENSTDRILIYLLRRLSIFRLS